MDLDKLARLADLERFGTYDYAVPHDWLMVDPEKRRPHFWWYPAKPGRQSMFGRPLKWMAVARLALRRYRIAMPPQNSRDLHTYMEVWKFVHPGKQLDAFGENLIREWIETEGRQWLQILRFSFQHMAIPAPAWMLEDTPIPAAA